METRDYIAGLVAKARVAQKEFEANFTTQRKVDEVVRAIALTPLGRKEELARECYEESKMGTYEMKVSKIDTTAKKQWNVMRGQKSMGYIPNVRNEPGVRVVAKPIGVVGCICPATNPITTIMANSMMAIKCPLLQLSSKWSIFP